MAAKQLLFDEAARQAILRGVQKLARPTERSRLHKADDLPTVSSVLFKDFSYGDVINIIMER